MKKLKLFTLAFVLGMASIFATNDLPCNPSEKSKTLVENLLFETAIANETEIGDKNYFLKKNSLDKKQIVNKNKTTDIIDVVNNYDNMNSKNSQARQIRNYSYIMSDIMKKE